MAKWKEVKKFLFHEFPEGWFYSREKVSERAAVMSAFLVAITFLMFIWFAVNAPIETTEVAGKEVVKAGGMKWRWIGIVYAVMGSFAVTLTAIEWVKSKKLRPVAVPMPGPGDWDIPEVVVVGVAIAGGAMLVSSLAFATTGTWAFVLQIFPKMPLTNWAIVGFSIPIIEEAFFGSVIAGSFTENYGLAVGLMVPSTIFALFHWGVYGLSASLLVPIFLFRSLATLSMVFSRSWLVGVVGHILVNSASVLMVF